MFVTSIWGEDWPCYNGAGLYIHCLGVVSHLVWYIDLFISDQGLTSANIQDLNNSLYYISNMKLEHWELL